MLAWQVWLVKSKYLHEALSILEAKRGALMTDTSTGLPPSSSSAVSTPPTRSASPDWLKHRSTRQPRSLHT
jgi:hypothetical protein